MPAPPHGEGREVGGGVRGQQHGRPLFGINRVPWEQHFMSCQKGLELVMLSFLRSEVTLAAALAQSG